jgi:L-fuconolactonase
MHNRGRMDQEHAAWLARTTEEPLEPELAICDPHHHLWYDRPPISGRYLVDELHQDTGSGHHVVTTVYAESQAEVRTDGPEALRPVGETEFAATQAEESEARPGATIAGIIPHADLSLGDGVEEVLVEHEKAGRGRFRGIRQSAAWDAYPPLASYMPVEKDYLYRTDVRQGLRVLARMGYVYDAWVYHPQIPDVTALARAVPEATIVLDHLGGPVGIGPYANRDEVRAVWRPAITEAASCPNIVMKLGGIGMPRFGVTWRERDRPPTSEELAAWWAPEVEHCIEQFGPERCMFESNFPVDRVSISYLGLWNTFKRLAAGASAGEKASLFHDTATRVYRLG